MCDAIGLVEYVKLIKTRDFDPIYLCEGSDAVVFVQLLSKHPRSPIFPNHSGARMRDRQLHVRDLPLLTFSALTL